jgi:plastocyanin
MNWDCSEKAEVEMDDKSRAGSRRGAIAVTLTLACAAAAVFAPAASAATIYAGPQAASFNYLTPNVTISAGEPVTLMNFDLVSHDVTSEATYRPKRRKGQKRRPPPRLLFTSPLIGFGQSAPVEGTQRMKAGQSYRYFCSLHPSMVGSINVN